MKKTIFLAIAMSVVLAGCTEEKIEKPVDEHAHHTAKEHEEVTAKEKNEAAVRIETKLLVKEEGGMFLDVSYPVLTGLKDTKKEEELNAEFLTIAKDIEAQTRQDEKDLVEAGSEVHAGGSLGVTTYLNTSRLISLDLEGYIYSGGANGTPFHLPFVYDIVEDKKLMLTDLFESGILPEEELLTLLTEGFTHPDYGDLLLEPITEINKEQPFYLTKDAIVFTFAKYEYTAGAAGAPAITIEKSKLPTFKKIYQ